MMSIYSLYDRVSGIHSVPVCFQNDQVAKRTFPHIVSENPTYKYSAADMELYKLGDYDETTGVVTPVTPSFLMRMEVEASE